MPTGTQSSTLPTRLMSREELADYLNVSVRQVDKFRESGEIPSVKVGGQIRFRPEDISAYLKANTENAGEATA